QKFAAEVPRMVATLTLLAVAALAVPTLAASLHTPAAAYVEPLSIACAVVVLVVFIASIPVALKGGPITIPSQANSESITWPLWLAVTVLVAAGIGAGLVSEWFVSALEPAILLCTSLRRLPVLWWWLSPAMRWSIALGFNWQRAIRWTLP